MGIFQPAVQTVRDAISYSSAFRVRLTLRQRALLNEAKQALGYKTDSALIRKAIDYFLTAPENRRLLIQRYNDAWDEIVDEKLDDLDE